MSIPVAEHTAPLLLIQRRVPWGLLGLLALAFIVVPLWGTDYWLNAILIPFLVLSLAGLGLNLLTGYTGQTSVGAAGFMAVGAFATYGFLLRLPELGVPVALLGGGVMAFLYGQSAVFGGNVALLYDQEMYQRLAHRLVLDPGIGFGKTVAQNFQLLAGQAELLNLGFPILAGWSRKSSLGAVLAQEGVAPEPAQRVSASVAAALLALERGANIVRVHDVAETVAALAVWQAARPI